MCNLQPRIKNLRQHIIFKNTIGVLLLCTFLLSITPKQVLHNLSANHKDSTSQRNSDRIEYNQIGFNCECYSVVATSPFTEIPAKLEISKLIHFSFYSESAPASILSNSDLYFSLRGPPAIA